MMIVDFVYEYIYEMFIYYVVLFVT